MKKSYGYSRCTRRTARSQNFLWKSSGTHLVYKEYRPTRKFPDEFVRIHLEYEEYRLITKFPVEVLRIHLVNKEYSPATKFPAQVV